MHNRAAIALCGQQRREHPRMIGAGVLANDEDGLRLVEIFQGYGSLPNSNRLGKGNPARLVAHVRAVRQVVCAELSNEKLVEESCLVAGTARRVKEGLVR